MFDDHYVYTHSLDKNVFYVGRSNGSLNKYKQVLDTQRSVSWVKYVNGRNDEVQIEIVEFCSKYEEYKKWIKWIEHYRSLGLNILF